MTDPTRNDDTVECPTDDDLDAVLRLDITDPRLYAGERPERFWRTMRRAGVPLRMGGFREHWAVTRYSQIRHVLRHTSALSSEQGNRLGEKASDAAAGPSAGGLSILVADDPGHTDMRRVLEPAFSPRAVRRLTGGVHELARRLVRRAAARPSVDFVEHVVGPLLTTVACDLVGVPHADRRQVADWCQAAFRGAGHATATSQVGAHVELLGYCDSLLAGKRRDPGEDAASLLAGARIDGAPLRREAAIMNCHDLLLGGNASARYVLTSLPVTVTGQPEFWRLLRSGPVDLAGATQELLRRECPVNHVMRTVLDDIEVDGVTMHRGDIVSLWLRSGNLDDDVYEDADVMRPDRTRPAPHLAFGYGLHHCIAANLARLEVQALLRAMVELTTDADLVAAPVRMQSCFLRGYRSVPIALRARP